MKLKEVYIKRSMMLIVRYFSIITIFLIALYGMIENLNKLVIGVILAQSVIMSVGYYFIRKACYKRIVLEDDKKIYYVLKKSENILNIEGILKVGSEEAMFTPFNERKNSLTHKREGYKLGEVKIEQDNDLISIKTNKETHEFKVFWRSE